MYLRTPSPNEVLFLVRYLLIVKEKEVIEKVSSRSGVPMDYTAHRPLELVFGRNVEEFETVG